MPKYVAEYDTILHFFEEEYFKEPCSDTAHGGFVLANGGLDGFKSTAELTLKLESNPLFTASVLTSYAKANARAFERGCRGVKAILDIPVCDILEGIWIDKVKAFV